jgi:hypothetical protein
MEEESNYIYLPAELHYLILQHLEFDIASLTQLRASNKWFYDFLALENIIDDILVWEKQYQQLTVSPNQLKIKMRTRKNLENFRISLPV